ncbi:N-acetyltransferase [Curtobacterium citreum]|uniref:GNAT family N-acetyltransferase n=1 Tax=Curtobacterium citreum TaxID=2036 RepID=A0ABT2HKD6_9MICO|nr:MULTISPECIES: GNAT family N-acetyltransferase [Curtobacterium]MCS6523736.1 GNAT family N-acetyltransferase [Curtobacterium citreum]RDH95487.1 acetyltransferase (GNAT) family protein [Curtobacterium sp. AG1037]TQJ26472.1 acetyltransferase (GNAT) family protein [Curtobacterium citreum]GGL87602.1 N-acetyltransferase [Curtobacterium citreum]
MTSISSERPTTDELVDLYDAVGWTAYTRDPAVLRRAVDGSHRVLAARDDDGVLVGLVRVVSDGATIAYVQDLLVRPAAQRTGVGGALLDAVLERYGHVRQTVLLTDAEPGQRAFYESRGFTEAHDVEPSSLRAFVLLR